VSYEFALYRPRPGADLRQIVEADFPDEDQPDARPLVPLNREEMAELADRVQARLRRRSPAWILGTSFLFEAVLVGLATAAFVRRDF